MRVDVHHPTAATWVPRGGRKPIHLFASMVTSCEVPQVPDASMREVMRLGMRGTLLCEHGGVPWRRLEVPVSARERRSLTPAEFREALSRPANDGGAGQNLFRDLAMTPLAALAASQADPKGHGVDRGVPLSALAGGTLLHVDGGDAARAFLAVEMLVTDAAVWRRYRPTADMRFDSLRLVHDLRHQEDALPWGLYARAISHRPDRAALEVAAKLDRDPTSIDTTLLNAERALLAGFPDEDEDLRVAANWIPYAISRGMEGRTALLGHRSERPASALAERLRPMLAKGCVGTIGSADAPSALHEASAIIGDMLLRTVAIPSKRHADEHMAGLAAYASTAPLRLDLGIAPEDEDAMGGMAP